MSDVRRPADGPGVGVEASSPVDPVQSIQQVVRATWLGLLGFMNENEAVGLAKGQGVSLREEESKAIADRIQKARAYVQGLGSRAGDPPAVREVDPSLHHELAGLPQETSFQQHLIEVDSWSFCWVELRKLIVFQPIVNLDYVSARMAEAGHCKEPVETIRFCLPLTASKPKSEATTSFDPASNTFAISTTNIDMRILGMVQGKDPGGSSFTGFAFGGGLPQMSVAEYQGRYILKNGYHRAVALLRAGIAEAPCLVVRTRSYNATGASLPGFLPRDLVLSDRPPRLEDFDSSEAAVPFPRRPMKAVIVVQAQRLFIPM